jgi:hypothetical protein
MWLGMVRKGGKLWRTNRREEDEIGSSFEKRIGRAGGTCNKKP